MVKGVFVWDEVLISHLLFCNPLEALMWLAAVITISDKGHAVINTQVDLSRIVAPRSGLSGSYGNLAHDRARSKRRDSRL